ncbi:hypothetical protein QE152_g32212 [Popillia japonica]|uniref:Uncharacterized protein n=1 Tax=Popillia japonica TaxID=7064 RepID=A0AAW1IZS6_POPJA
MTNYLILKAIKDVKEEQIELRNEIKQFREDQKVFNKEINHLKEENEKLKKENNIIKKELTNIKKELVDVKNEMNWIEKDKKKNRVVVKRLQINTSDTEWNLRTHMKNEYDKLRVMSNKSELRKMGSEKIYIDDYLTKKEREKQKHVAMRAQEEKRKGKLVKIGYSKVIIDGVEWRWNRNSEQLEIHETKN